MRVRAHVSFRCCCRLPHLLLLKPPLFRGIDRARAAFGICAPAIAALRFDPQRCRGAMGAELDATERANRLVADEGLSFREAYRRVAASLPVAVGHEERFDGWVTMLRSLLMKEI